MSVSSVRADPVEARTRSPFDKLRANGTLLLFTSILLHSSWAVAVEVEPSRLELKIPAGQPAHGELRISNRGHNAVEVRVSAGPYRFPNPNMKLPSCEGWFHFEPSRFTLAQGAATSVAYTATPPANLDVDTAGEYLAAILVDQYPAQTEQPATPPAGPQSRLTVVPRIALAVYIGIEGRDRVQMELGSPKARKIESGATGGKEAHPDLLLLEVPLKNLGTVHVRPSGTYALFEQEGHLYRTAPLGKSMPVLPGGGMTIPSVLPLPPEGRYRWVITVEVQEGTLLQKEAAIEITKEGAVVLEEKK